MTLPNTSTQIRHELHEGHRCWPRRQGAETWCWGPRVTFPVSRPLPEPGPLHPNQRTLPLENPPCSMRSLFCFGRALNLDSPLHHPDPPTHVEIMPLSLKTSSDAFSSRNLPWTLLSQRELLSIPWGEQLLSCRQKAPDIRLVTPSLDGQVQRPGALSHASLPLTRPRAGASPHRLGGCLRTTEGHSGCIMAPGRRALAPACYHWYNHEMTLLPKTPPQGSPQAPRQRTNQSLEKQNMHL